MEYLRLIRVNQWVKNFFVFLPMFFGGRLFMADCWCHSFIAFVVFSFASSAIYCLNDCIDVEKDRMHPTKRNRPIAAGTITKRSAMTISAICAIVSLTVSVVFLPNPYCTIIVILYLALNLGYVFVLKDIAILDVFIIAIGFVLRLYEGGAATSIPLSPWIVTMTFLLTLFLGFAKRRDDLIQMGESGNKALRKSSSTYNAAFLNQTLGVLASITIVCYLMFTISPSVTERIGSDYLFLTSLFVIFGILRYLQIAIVMERSGDPSRTFLKDPYIIGTVVCWIVTYTYLLYK